MQGRVYIDSADILDERFSTTTWTSLAEAVDGAAPQDNRAWLRSIPGRANRGRGCPAALGQLRLRIAQRWQVDATGAPAHTTHRPHRPQIFF
jgi:hypothetical protein